jgi:hypothetical protein
VLVRISWMVAATPDFNPSSANTAAAVALSASERGLNEP